MAADRFLDSLERACEMLARHPLIGRSREEPGQNLRSYPVGNYLIFYIPGTDRIDVARIIYGGRNLLAVFE
jgi:toxin ParE1/3/4